MRKQLLVSALLATLLAACSSTPKPESGAGVEDRGAGSSSSVARVDATQPSGSGIAALRDPKNILSKREIYFDFRQARLQFQEVRQIPAEERQARWDAYMALPAEERAALARRSRSIPKAAAASATRGTLTVLPNQKVNVVNAPSKPVTPKVVGPTIVQAKPGASTTLISKTPTPPAHEAAGEPKISVPGVQVNRATLLPNPAPAVPPRPPAAPAAQVAASAPIPDAAPVAPA